jgi:phytanoyl-CoA hydroxylase
VISIPDSMVGKDGVPVAMRAGDVLFFHKKMMHSSLPNTSDDIRWSFDLRYNPIGQPTGRPWLPGFVARSESHPDTALTDHPSWAQLWQEARHNLCLGHLSSAAKRWADGDPRCA